MDPNLFYVRVWDLDVFKKLWLGEFKNMLLHQFDDPMPWKQPKMATKHNYLKSLNSSHRMKINFLFTVHTNIMLSSLLPRILWLLCSSFILLYYLHFMLVKMIPIFQIGINLKQILPSTNRLVKVKINTYTNCTQTFKTLRSYNLEKGIKVRLWENVHEKKKSILPDMNPLDIWQIMHVKDTMHAK